MLLVALAFFAGDFSQCHCERDPGDPNCQGGSGGGVAQQADPPIPRFDKWTNTNPENECLSPPRPF